MCPQNNLRATRNCLMAVICRKAGSAKAKPSASLPHWPEYARNVEDRPRKGRGPAYKVVGRVLAPSELCFLAELHGTFLGKARIDPTKPRVNPEGTLVSSIARYGLFSNIRSLALRTDV